MDLTVRELPPRQRPRERLRLSGPEALSLAELLALLVGSGHSGVSSLRMAERILSSCGGKLRGMAALTAAELEGIPGVGEATAARLVAALELGRRAAEEALPERPRIHSAVDVHQLMAPRLRHLPHEEFHALLLNTQHALIQDLLITRGILDASLIHPREVFRPAIAAGAASVILVHNHPSGDPTPSAEDRAVTQQMIEAGRLIGIRVLDHVVIGERGWATAI